MKGKGKGEGKGEGKGKGKGLQSGSSRSFFNLLYTQTIVVWILETIEHIEYYKNEITNTYTVQDTCLVQLVVNH